MKKLLCLSLVTLALCVNAFADIARPDKTPARTPKPKGVDTSMTIRLDRDATEARLLIPRSQIKQLRAELEQMDDDGDNTTAGTAVPGKTQTIVSGMFLSLAIVFGGIWFVRSGKVRTPGGKIAGSLALLAAVGSAATLVYANAGPPSEARSITGKMFSRSVHLYNFGYGRVRLETAPASEGDGVILIVPNPAEDKPGQ
jgi:hypothetical protein